MNTPAVVCLGEPLVAFLASGEEPLSTAVTFSAHVVGAESNVAVGLARLGVPAALVARRGEDPHGQRIDRALRAEAVIVDHVRADPAATGVLFRSVRPFGMSEVHYGRAGSAGSRLDARDVRAAGPALGAAAWLHVSGISAVMSQSGEEAVREAMATARAAATKVSFDVNLRERLRPLDEQRPLLLELASSADLVFCGDDEGERLLGTADPWELAGELRELGASTIVIKRGAAGALAVAADGARIERPARQLARIVDVVGAGDAFAAGVLAELLAGRALEHSLDAGAICAAYAMSCRGDTEGLPGRAELEFARERGGDGVVR